MGNKEDQQKEELDVFRQLLKTARAKGGEARRNVARLSGEPRPFDRPDIVVAAENGGLLIGLEHFQVDHYIGRGKKVESRAAKFSSAAEKFRKLHEGAARSGALPKEAYEEFGELISRAIRDRSNACVDDIAISLEAGLFGEDGRGHVSKLGAYRDRVAEINPSADVQLGFVIEFHTDLSGWFINDGHRERKVVPGEFPVSLKVYDLLNRASAHVDWILLAFCPPFGQEVHDAAVIKCGGMFETSCARQGLFPVTYIGFGSEASFGKQKRQGEVHFDIGEHDVNYLIENTSERVDGAALFQGAINGAAEALNQARSGSPFAATTSVQLVYDSVKDILKHKKGRVEPGDVLDAIFKMGSSERDLRMKQWGKRWNVGKA
ncbi:hypothetical protein [Ellagibacter isourolithinifaciens]|uniref:hypothetical protein n=1 Tax=Eggerthellaceae TaxID=1643826 RepID=UPI003A8DCF27